MNVSPVVVEGAKKATGIFLFPGGKLSWLLTGFFFAVLILAASFQSVEQKSIYPLVRDSVLRLVSADSQVDQAVLEVRSSPLVPKFVGWFRFVNVFDPWWILWASFWFTIASCLWFLYFFFMICYNAFQALDSTSPIISFIGASIFFLLLSSLGNVLVYHASLAGTTLPEKESSVLVDDLSHAVPLGGFFRLAVFGLYKQELWQKLADFGSSKIINGATNIPTPQA